MRAIKFRGKTEDDMVFEDGRVLGKGTWVYGSLIVNGKLPYIVGEIIESDSEYIALEYWYPCDENTIGQYTGLKDKNGVEIYEGDILNKKYVVIYTDENVASCGCCIPSFEGIGFVAEDLKNKSYGDNIRYYLSWSNTEITGNIHEVKE